MRTQTTWALLLFALTIATPSIALTNNGLREGMQKCRSVSTPTKRLQCFDSLASKLTPTQQDTKATSNDATGKWLVDKDKDPLNDSKKVTAILVAKSGQSPYGRPVALVVQCLDGNTLLYVNWGAYLGESAEVTYRVGDQEAQTSDWNLSTDSQSSFYPDNVRNLVKEMTETNRFIAQVTPYQDNPITAVFDTAGMSKAIQSVREACGW